MTVYIIFGDTPRSDGDNIEGIFLTKESASLKMRTLSKFNGIMCDYHLEEFEVEE